MDATAAEWANYNLAAAGAAGALTGLLFVAVSLRPAEIRESPLMTGRARLGFFCFATVLVAGLVDLAPTASALIGGVQVITAIVVMARSAPFTVAAQRAGQLHGHYARVGAYYAAYLALGIGGALRGVEIAVPASAVVLAGALLGLLLVGLVNSWSLVLTHHSPGGV